MCHLNRFLKTHSPPLWACQLGNNYDLQDTFPENDIEPSDEAFQDNLIDVPIRGEIQDVDLCQESSMVSGSERSSRDGSHLRRHRTLSVPLPPTSQSIPPLPTSQVHLHRLLHLGGGALAVKGPLGELQRGGSLIENNGMSPSSEDMAWALLQITLRVTWALYQKCILTYQWERTEKTDREMLAHMSAMHRSWRSKPKKRHFNGKSLDDAIASVPAGVDSSDWQTMCEMWTTGDERSNMHGRTPHRLEVFKMGRCKDLPDGSESWVDEESRRRYEAMTQMIAPSSDVDAESHTSATPEDAFISVMGKDRPGRVCCAGSGETLGTWYRSIGTPISSERERIMQEQLKAQEEKLKA
ncbi:hypothetical protein Taro_052274 [Colocasia esculenta]|uniref:Uncharacterized protein n=1 Tax=Colocasia esculenta TaxID=4460 RepID=A0A843XJ88_COLES|nr:hypothetical protein [Colocasia esculenta]